MQFLISGQCRVTRGGGSLDGQFLCRSATRNTMRPTDSSIDPGFRLVLNLKQELWFLLNITILLRTGKIVIIEQCCGYSINLVNSL
jgi:hypothetical protein